MSKLVCLGDTAYLLYPLVPLQWMCALARMQGRLKYFIRRRERAAVRNNFLVTFGNTKSQREIDVMTCQFFEYKQLRVLLLYLLPKLKPSRRDKLFPIKGLNHVNRALLQDKGVILLGSHLNSIITFIGKHVLRTKGYDARVALPTKTLPYAPTLLRSKIIDKLSLNHSNVHSGMFYAQFNVRPIVQSLAENAVLILMGDGWHSAGFVEVQFLGRSIPFTTGAMSIARMTETPVVPFFITGSPPDGMKIVIEEPIPLEKSANAEQDLEIMVGQYAQRLEYHLKQNILCWEHWLHDHALDTMAGLLEKSLSERYTI